MFHRVALGLGSNLGERAENLRKALALLGRAGEIKKVSSLYETAPLGLTDQPSFLNAVALLETVLNPRTVLSEAKAIEEELGRVPGPRWSPRGIDLDIISYDNLFLSEKDLIIPHPEMERRRFVLEPLAEILPHWVHPVSQKSVEVLLKECPKQGCVRLGELDV
jgi:2-amino-4-hydroxy-6-hydroxymethyldihydropteridine diphosphokinase